MNQTESSVFFARGSSSWTEVIPKTEHNKLFLNCDYGSTTLGPIADWGPSLRLYASMVFADSRGAVVYWGPDKIAFYNEKAVDTLQGAHPYLFGHGFNETFPTLSQKLSPVFDQAAATGQTVDVNDILLFPERNGFLEEVYCIGQFIPLRGDSGKIEGFYNTVMESTAQVLSKRRRKVLDQIAAVTLLPVDKTLSKLVDALRTNPHDITAALLYSFEDSAPDGSSNLRLRGSIGFPEGHRSAPPEAHLETGQDGLVPWFRQVRITGKPQMLSTTDGNLSSLFDGITWCGYGEPSRAIVVCPLEISGNLLGFYVQGINPRRVYDEIMESSIVDILRQMEVKWINSITTQQAELRERTLERRATDTERRLRHMAQNAPLGMCQIGHDQRIQWANDQFYQIVGHDRSKPEIAEVRKVIAADERERSARDLDELLAGSSSFVREIRLERRWTPPAQEGLAAEPVAAWMLAVTFPFTEDGHVKLVMVYVTDISHQKWAEAVQTRNAAAATLAKQRQEEFMDVVSHEVRNPLSAMTQLADGIVNSTIHIKSDDKAEIWRSTAQESVAAASTILACAAHQKRIIDDVLILSRLESHMLSITPVVAQPSRVVADTIKMVSGEARANDVEIVSVRDQSYSTSNFTWTLLDTSRVTQILINLMSNAIKFTASQSKRRISVSYGQTSRRQHSFETGFGALKWIPPKEPRQSNRALPELVDGEEKLYLYFCVQDTGAGIMPYSLGRLFKRFSQATSKTHITYGGSGLGLYICRELAGKQGGGVGVASAPGEGSAFAFYIESRAAEAPGQLPTKPPISLTKPPQVVTQRSAVPRRSSSIVEKSNGVPSIGSCAELKEEGFHILLVEDNLINQKVLAKQLRMAKCKVTVANNGVEALSMLKQADSWLKETPDTSQSGDQAAVLHVDVVLMDVEMPVMDGLQCSRQIRQLEGEGRITKRLPIIATTANVRQEQQDSALAAGVDSVLSKPFTVSEVLARIREVLVEQ